MLETLLLQKLTFLLPGSRGTLLPIWITQETLFFISFIWFSYIYLSIKNNNLSFSFGFFIYFTGTLNSFTDSQKWRSAALHSQKIGFNNKYEDGTKSLEQAPTSPLLCCVISSLLAYGQMGKKGEVWPQKLADVNIQTKHMAALAGTKPLADSLFPPTSFSCLM